MSKVSPKMKKQIRHMKQVGKRSASYIASMVGTDTVTVRSVK